MANGADPDQLAFQKSPDLDLQYLQKQGTYLGSAGQGLTHFSLETPKRVFGKQYRPRSDAAWLKNLTRNAAIGNRPVQKIMLAESR